jgi:hypothetical protein
MTVDELNAYVADDEKRLDAADAQLWRRVRVTPAKWKLHPWGDALGGFWVVGIVGQQVIWLNEIEGGFNISSYTEYGTIDQYWCNDDELVHAMRALRGELESGQVRAKCGPPQPIIP